MDYSILHRARRGAPLSTNLDVQTLPPREPGLDETPAASARGLPPEIVATVLAVSTVPLGALLGLPVYGIFLGWAAAGLSGGRGLTGIRVLGTCVCLGALFGTGTLMIQSALAQALGPAVPTWAAAAIVLAIVNPVMVALGRMRALASVPGMFVGFSTVLAVHLGGGGPLAENPLGALLIGVSMNLTGLGFHVIGSRVTAGRRRRRPRATASLGRSRRRRMAVALTLN